MRTVGEFDAHLVKLENYVKTARQLHAQLQSSIRVLLQVGSVYRPSTRVRWKCTTWKCRTWNWETKPQDMKLQDTKKTQDCSSSSSSFNVDSRDNSRSYNVLLDLLSGHFGPRTLRPQDTSALNYSAEVSGQFGTGAEVSWCRSVRTPLTWLLEVVT